MRQVILDSIYFSAFKSFSQPTTITLSKSAGLKFLGGRNLVDPRLGSNGSGKSTIWDGLCWCLYGAGVRGQKASELTTWGEKQPHVIVHLSIDGVICSVERHGSPNRLLINKEPATQQDVDEFVGLSRDRFLQSVLFGQGAPLFLDLSINARGELLDSVLDLSIWAKAAEVAGRQYIQFNFAIVQIDQKLAFERGKLVGIEDDTSLQQSSADWKETNSHRLNDVLNDLEVVEQSCRAMQAELDTSPEPASLADIDAEIDEAQQALRQVDDLDRQTEFYQSHDECPVCHHPLDESFIGKKFFEIQNEVHRLVCDGLPETRIQDAKERKGQISLQREHCIKLKASLSAAQRQVQFLIKQAETIGEEKNPYLERARKVQELREASEGVIQELEANKLTLQGQMSQAEYWKQGFRKVRLFQVKQVLQRMEIETSNAAAALGIGDWKIRYVTEVENKSGTLKPGIQVIVSAQGYEGPWEGFSGGEAQRVRLAVTLGLASLIQGLAGVSWQMEVFDESSQYLSAEGIEDLLTCLSNRADITRKSIFITDHTQLSYGAFAEVLCCVKDAAGSRLEVLSQALN